jgi:hypothetical protein
MALQELLCGVHIFNRIAIVITYMTPRIESQYVTARNVEDEFGRNVTACYISTFLAYHNFGLQQCDRRNNLDTIAPDERRSSPQSFQVVKPTSGQLFA